MTFKNKEYKILLSGGGTGGSVAPLLAVAEELKLPPDKGGNNPPYPLYQGVRFEFLWLGTKQGIEREMVEQAGIKFKAITAGKLRRYFSFKNFLDILKIKIGFWQSFWLMLRWRPDLVMSAGAFVSVPVVWAAWLLRAPVIIHQQDIRPGLANKLMAPFAKMITVTFEKSLADYGKKALWVGNPVRNQLKIKDYLPTGQAGELRINNSKIQKNLPVVLILGGGTGAEAINRIVEQCLDELSKFCQIIHVTGKNKSIKSYPSRQGEAEAGELPAYRTGRRITNYAQYEFLDAEQMAEAMALADVVVTRAGMGVLSELSDLAKPAIIIPMPDSHQAENAAMFKGAAIILDQKNLTAEKLADEIKLLIGDARRREELSEKITKATKKGANEVVVKIINGILKKI